MADIKKVIYFPKEWSDGPYNKLGYPRIIYCFVVRDDVVVGSAWEDEAKAGRGKACPVKRCLPYTDLNWHLCQKHIEKRDELESEYNQLIALARKSAPNKSLNSDERAEN